MVESGPLNMSSFAVSNLVNEERAAIGSGGGGGLGSRRQSASNSAHGIRRPSSNPNNNNASINASRPSSSLMPTAPQPAASAVTLAAGVAVAQAAKDQAVPSAVSVLPRNAPMAAFLVRYLGYFNIFVAFCNVCCFSCSMHISMIASIMTAHSPLRLHTTFMMHSNVMVNSPTATYLALS